MLLVLPTNGKDRGALLLDFSESPENRVLFTEVTWLELTNRVRRRQPVLP